MALAVLASTIAVSIHAAETGTNWVSLFNGTNLTGWGYGTNNFNDLTASDDNRYSASNGVLTVHPKVPRQLRTLWTTRQFPRDFVLKLEFRAETNADSGIFIRKPQLQCRDYLVAGPYKNLKQYKPQDWNEIVVTVSNGLAYCTCNGEVLTNGLAVPATGPIGLEADRGQMEYRNIRLKELKNPWLTPGKFYTEEQGKAKLSEFSKTYSDRAGWEQRAQAIQTGILRGAGLNPLPPRTELNVIRREAKQQDGYTLENVAFESRPGFFVTGNLYRPTLANSAIMGRPAVLVTHGHAADAASGGRFREGTQRLCGTLAHAGAVVFAYDMVGYGEATQYEHKTPITLGLQLWNSMRAVDFLQSLPEVDGTKIGITGESGGATQALLLAAVDDRIAVSVPVVMVSAHFFGGCACESGMPVHRSATHETCNAEIAALAAPRPQLIISDGKDWTVNVPNVEFPYIRNVYRLIGAEDKVENLHLASEGHDYGPSKRMGAYVFLSKYLGLSRDSILYSVGNFDERVVIHKREDLLVFDASNPLPAHALQSPEAIESQFYQHLSANRQVR